MINAVTIADNMYPLLQQNNLVCVHSLFKNAVNLQLGKRLIHISSEKDGLTPFGLQLKESDFKTFLATINKQTPFCIENNTLKSINTGIEINIKTAKIISTYFKEETKEISLKNMVQILENGLSIASKYKVGLIINEEKQHQLKDYIENQNNPEILAFFIGRGIGLTPSGDDMIVGILASLYALYAPKAISAFKKDIIPYLKNTNTIAQEYLFYAIKGSFSQSIHTVLTALLKQNKLDAIRSIFYLLHFGHTSGADTLFGIQTALQALSKTTKV